MEYSGARGGGVRGSTASHETGERPVVSGYGRRGLPEYLFDWLRAAEARADSFRGPHLQDGLREDDEAAPGLGGRHYVGHDSDRSLADLPIRRGRRGQGRAHQRVSGKAEGYDA